jgi:hypothetical protein
MRLAVARPMSSRYWTCVLNMQTSTCHFTVIQFWPSINIMDLAIAGPRPFALGVCLAGVQAYLWYAHSKVTSAYMSTVASDVVY